MLGSQEPAAWAAFADDTGDTGVTSLNRASVEEVANRMGWSVAPLYLSPTLTDEEKAAIALAKSRLGTSDRDWQADDVLAELLERLG
jgi:hypothetical protein